jgi:hypothetical protein
MGGIQGRPVMASRRAVRTSAPCLPSDVCSQRLGDLIAALDPADEAGSVALLGTGR